MTLLAQWLEAWGAAMGRASWQGGLAVLAVWALCWAVPSIPARFQAWLWRLALMKFLVALLWPVPIELALLPAPELPHWESSGVVLAHASAVESGAGASQEIATYGMLLLVPFLAWAAVVCWQGVGLAFDFRGAARLRNGCRPSEDLALVDQLARLSRSVGLRAPPVLLQMEGHGSPLLVGICRPAMVLPADSVSRLDESERSLVLGHELAHLLRGDLFWGLVAAVVRMFFCFHPLAWLSERQTRLTQEIAADELAISLQKQDPAQYATLLVSVVSKISPRPLLPAALCAGVAGSHWSLKRRLSAMRFTKPVSPRTVFAYGLLLAVIALTGIVPWAVVAAETPDRPAPKEASASGKLVSFNDGLLKIQGEDGKELEWKVAAETKAITVIQGVEKESTAGEVFKIVEPGILMTVKTKGDQVALLVFGAKRTEKVVSQEKGARGRFVSFRDGTLTIQANSGALIATRIPENAKTQLWSDDKGAYQPASAAEALAKADPGAKLPIVVRGADENVTLMIGARKGQAVGTFVSYKNDRLLLLGKNLGESFVKKYGNSVHFHKFRDDVPVYESIDGGEYKLAGTPGTTLGNVKEGTIVTVHGQGDDNITLIQIGVPKKD